MFSEIKWRFISAVMAGLMLLVLHAFQWSIVDRVTPFLYMPLAFVVWLALIAAGIASLTCLTKFKSMGIRSLIPTIVVGLCVLIVTFVPFTNLWLKFDYYFYKKERNEIVQRINRGDLKPNVGYNNIIIALDNTYPLVSMGGNKIIVEEHGNKKYVLFFTFRGILDNYSGFLYVPSGGSPSMFSDLNEQQSTEIVLLDENWYYASHR